jgi:signal transduction histidine kinase
MTLSQRFDPENILLRVVFQAFTVTQKQFITSDGCCSSIIFRSGNVLHYAASYPANVQEFRREYELEFVDILKDDQGTSSIVRVFETSQPIREEHVTLPRLSIEFAQEKFARLLVPVVLDNHVLAVILVQHPFESFFTESDVESLTFVATHAASMIQISRLLRIRFGLAAITLPFITLGHDMAGRISSLHTRVDRISKLIDAEEVDRNDIQEKLRRLDDDISKLPLGELREVVNPNTSQEDMVDLVKLISEIARQNKDFKSLNESQKKFDLIENCMFECNREWMGYALNNVLGNALQAIESVPEERKLIHIILERTDENIRLLVKNTGTRIANHVLFKLYREPFRLSETDRLHLGAFIAGEIIYTMSGTIDIIETDEHSTTTEIRLPI